MNPLQIALAPKPAMDTPRKPVEPAARADRDERPRSRDGNQDGFSDVLRSEEERAAARKRANDRSMVKTAGGLGDKAAPAEAATPVPTQNETDPAADVDFTALADAAPDMGFEEDAAMAAPYAHDEEGDPAEEAAPSRLQGDDAASQRPKPAPDAPAASLLSARFAVEGEATAAATERMALPAAAQMTTPVQNSPSVQTAIAAPSVEGLQAAALSGKTESAAAQTVPAARAEPLPTEPAQQVQTAAPFVSRRAQPQPLQGGETTAARADGSAVLPAEPAKPDSGLKAAEGPATAQPQTLSGADMENRVPVPMAAPAPEAARPTRREIANRAADRAAQEAAPTFSTQRTAQSQPTASVMQAQVSASPAPAAAEQPSEIEWVSDVDFAFEARNSDRLPQTAMARLETLMARPEIPRHIAEQLASVAQRISDRKPVEIALNPEELGRVRMSLSTAEGGMVVSVVAERSETLDLMRRNIEQLAEQFREIGYDDVSFSFGTQSGAAGGDGASQGGAFSEHAGGSAQSPETDAPAATTEDMAARITLTPTEGLDLRL